MTSTDFSTAFIGFIQTCPFLLINLSISNANVTATNYCGSLGYLIGNTGINSMNITNVTNDLVIATGNYMCGFFARIDSCTLAMINISVTNSAYMGLTYASTVYLGVLGYSNTNTLTWTLVTISNVVVNYTATPN
jgi:hypothetical protein